MQMMEQLGEELESFEHRLEATLGSDVKLVQEIARYLIERKGKRLRPILTILSAQATGGTSEDVYDAAVAVEMIHTATLVHDDVVDSSKMRRGVSSVNSIWDNQVAVLMGDFLFSRALSLLVRVGSKKAVASLSQATERISRGEFYEIERSQDLDLIESTYLQMIGDKTAALFSAACEIGAILAGANDDETVALRDFGEHFGLAFQMTDDLLDYVGDPDILGKPTGSDLRGRKITLPLIRALSVCHDGEARRVRDRIESGIDTDEAWQDVASFVEDHGGIAYAMEVAARHAKSAGEAVESLRPSSARNLLYQAVSQSVTRQR